MSFGSFVSSAFGLWNEKDEEKVGVPEEMEEELLEDAPSAVGSGGKKKRKKKKKKKTVLPEEKQIEAQVKEEPPSSPIPPVVVVKNDEPDVDDESFTKVESKRKKSTGKSVNEVEKTNIVVPPEPKPAPVPVVPAAAASEEKETPMIPPEKAQELPLVKRLEIAASHSNLEAALHGLVAWSEMVIGHPDMDTLFTSNAFQLLFENIFDTCPTSKTVDQHLERLLTTCLATSQQPSSTENVAHALVDKIRSVIEILREMKTKDKVPVNVSAIVDRLTQLIHSYRSRTMGTPGSVTASLAGVNLQIKDTQAKLNKTKGNDVRELFRRRDLQTESIQHCKRKIEALGKLRAVHTGEESAVSMEEPKIDATSSFLDQLSALDDDEMKKALSSVRKTADDVQLRLDTLRQEQQTKLTPLTSELTNVATEMDDMQKKRTELLAQVAALDESISQVRAKQTQMEEQIDQVHRWFEKETGKFDAEHQGIMSLLQCVQGRDRILSEFTCLEKELDEIVMSSTKDVQETIEGALPNALGGYFQVLSTYVSTETSCIRFIRNRLESSNAKLENLEKEVAEYKSLGIVSVAQELGASASKLRDMMAEDENCLNALTRKSQELCAEFKNVVLQHQATIEPHGGLVSMIKSGFETLGCGASWSLPAGLSKKTSTTTSAPNPTMESTAGKQQMTAQATSVPKFSWAQTAASPPPSSKSIYEIQAEQMTKSNDQI